MERAEAEAIYDSGRERCVALMLELARGLGQLRANDERLEERIGRLEGAARSDSRNSSAPLSADPPYTRAQRRALARAKAKELSKGRGERKAGGQSGYKGSGR